NTNTTTSDLKTKFRIEKKHKISINHQINILYYLKESPPAPHQSQKDLAIDAFSTAQGTRKAH
ncbi:hypothetical protein, partial [Ralstonia pseudosolanacearum]|uniref:hypothetical protein n=1 Tax=Ralstonia pseudosolanacearum TaxID=1310165 RepID=UPI003CE72877